MRRVYVDSNVFFYARIVDRLYGEPCAQVLRSLKSGAVKGALSPLVPLEVANAMRKFGLVREAAGEVRAIYSMGLEVYPLEGTDSREAAEMADETGAGPYDAAHAVVMRRYGISEIISADRVFDRFGWLKRTDPQSFKGQSASQEDKPRK